MEYSCSQSMLRAASLPQAQGYTFHIYHCIHRGLAAEARGAPGDDDEDPSSLPAKRGGGRSGGSIPARYSVLEDSAGSSDGDEEACLRGSGAAVGLGSGLGRRGDVAGAVLEMTEPGALRAASRNDSAIFFDARAVRRKP